jgi:pSer/pThr/pTyr-binding forkhead associated (FHA) protein
MKVSLYVASGAHHGKVIPVPTQEFVIGRDRACHLRPASQAISKRHCGLVVRDGLVYLTDYGSTNGTLVNGVMVRSEEVEVPPGSTLTIGPLDFILQVEAGAAVPAAGDEAEQDEPVDADARSVEDTAAMLLALDDDQGGVRDGSTITEVPVRSAAETRVGDALPPAPRLDEKKKATSREEMTAAAGDILRKMRRRPK